MAARNASSDKLQSYRFHVKLVAGGPYGGELNMIGPVGSRFEAGFKTVTLPQITTETVNYREGISTFAQKFGGPPTVEPITLTRGVSISGTNFFDWLMAKIEGRDYRSDVSIYQMPITAVRRATAGAGRVNEPIPPGYEDCSIEYRLHEAQPSRVKLAGDLDADSGEVSISELELEYEWPEIIQPTREFPPVAG